MESHKYNDTSHKQSSSIQIDQSVINSERFNNEQIVKINEQTFDLSDKRFGVLNSKQSHVLNEILKKDISIIVDTDPKSSPYDKQSSTNYISFPLMIFLQIIQRQLNNNHIIIRDIRLNGGAASYVLHNRNELKYNDIDIIFNVNLQNESYFESIRECIYQILLDLCVPNIIEPDHHLILEQILTKMVKITDNEARWSLFSIKNFNGCTIEMKFVDKICRQYEFSVDSFQILLDNVLDDESTTKQIICESVYGDYQEALFHLDNKFIVTNYPEKIRGGGLFKYCFLLVRGFKPLCHKTMMTLEPYMVSRFFIDFNKFECHRDRLCNYMLAHFGDETMLKYQFLIIFCSVLKRSLNKSFNREILIKKYTEITAVCFCTMLREFIDKYPSRSSMSSKRFYRCACLKTNNICLHQTLFSSNKSVKPTLVTFVYDNAQKHVSKAKRHHNLLRFIECYEKIHHSFEEYSFCLLPKRLFQQINLNNHHSKRLNHYIISHSSLHKIDPISYKLIEDFCPNNTKCDFNSFNDRLSFNIKQVSNVYQSSEFPFKHLPDSLFPLDFPNLKMSINDVVSTLQIPFSPPENFTFCVVNRIPVIFNDPMDSGIFRNSIIINNIINSSSLSSQQSYGSNVIPQHNHYLMESINPFNNSQLLSLNPWQHTTTTTIPCDSWNLPYSYQKVLENGWIEFITYSPPLLDQPNVAEKIKETSSNIKLL
ncbi:RNA adenylyltransferase [Dermatophagoides pteronyssinus]|uniref:polynucleotide adenylyltransferase n=1 Tax=Dermatophagoides pteronyssinus TaxID=6956 RepID=A0ABQ8J6J1_DERPT|nr:RNA adenylyltransferase [Dermatophagoides pteronyssinus]